MYDRIYNMISLTFPSFLLGVIKMHGSEKLGCRCSINDSFPQQLASAGRNRLRKAEPNQINKGRLSTTHFNSLTVLPKPAQQTIKCLCYPLQDSCLQAEFYVASPQTRLVHSNWQCGELLRRLWTFMHLDAG